MFAALILARSGHCPIVVERGRDIDSRTADVNNFWTNRILDETSNIQYGEGGAGTFSDGKLNFIPKLGKSDLTKYMSISEANELINDKRLVEAYLGGKK